jgi:uncharacterized protein (DUF2062 family)
MAFFVGLFLAFIPVPGQMVLAALGAVMLRCNLPISVGLVWITNPLTVPAIFYLAYQVGALIIDVPLKEVEFVLSVQCWKRSYSESGDHYLPDVCCAVFSLAVWAIS